MHLTSTAVLTALKLRHKVMEIGGVWQEYAYSFARVIKIIRRFSSAHKEQPSVRLFRHYRINPQMANVNKNEQHCHRKKVSVVIVEWKNFVIRELLCCAAAARKSCMQKRAQVLEEKKQKTTLLCPQHATLSSKNSNRKPDYQSSLEVNVPGTMSGNKSPEISKIRKEVID